MDNRLIFLYLVQTELWGHGRVGRAGKGKTGASAKVSLGGKSPGRMLKRDAERIYSSEASEPMPSRKSAIVLYEPVP